MEQGWKPGDPAFLDPAIRRDRVREGARRSTIAGTGPTRGASPICSGRSPRTWCPESSCSEPKRKRAAAEPRFIFMSPRTRAKTPRPCNAMACAPFPFSIRSACSTPARLRPTSVLRNQRRSNWWRDGARRWRVARIRSAPSMASSRRRRSSASLGGVVGLGSDQAAGNNSHNIFSEMRSTAMFAKIAAGSPLAATGMAGAAYGDDWRSAGARRR